MPLIIQAKQVLQRFSIVAAASTSVDVPKGNFAVYVEVKEKKRFVVPISILKQPSFQAYQVMPRTNSGFITQWVASPFPTNMTFSLTSLLI